MNKLPEIQLSLPWIGKAWIDSVFILLPPFGCLLIIALFPSLFTAGKTMPDVWWVALILLVDVAHVYSTLYRTYFDRQAFTKQRNLLITIPFAGFTAGVLLFSISSILFWRVLAYVAVFHFIRQQYGFMRIYSRKEQTSKTSKAIDKLVVYYATIFPLLYWHLTAPRNFNWFIDGDFLLFKSDDLLESATFLYYAIIAVYIIKETLLAIRTRAINVPRIAVITGTLLSWYFGIVYFNGDLAFTLLNVVSHGIPYMALIYIYGKRNYSSNTSKAGTLLKLIFSRYGVLLFLGIIFLLAYVEEGFWDGLVWKDHQSIFSGFYFSDVQLSHGLLSFIVPLLALPQITHYVIDGFIWKIKQDNFKWNNEAHASAMVHPV